MYQKLSQAIVLFFLSLTFVQAQPPESKSAYEKEYERRIKKEMINDIYIPKDLTDAFKELTRKMDKSAKTKFTVTPEDTIVKKTYFSLGRWIAVNWGFYEGSRLSHWLKTEVGVSHPEDQSIFIIRTFHRSLNKKPLDVKALAEELVKNRKKEILKNKKIIKKETRKVPKKE